MGDSGRRGGAGGEARGGGMEGGERRVRGHPPPSPHYKNYPSCSILFTHAPPVTHTHTHTATSTLPPGAVCASPGWCCCRRRRRRRLRKQV
ncbi:hypothetical protein E2C01_043613 [Portunus trituberculatus]|uniref:Uncharacterized protein n=1 Tax=Portunus trituberculatus TaxID=210409 RepID=A0A5B7FX64_PORTR|nr:hypothetical protein [Portunus trituberculatus]